MIWAAMRSHADELAVCERGKAEAIANAAAATGARRLAATQGEMDWILEEMEVRKEMETTPMIGVTTEENPKWTLDLDASREERKRMERYYGDNVAKYCADWAGNVARIGIPEPHEWWVGQDGMAIQLDEGTWHLAPWCCTEAVLILKSPRTWSKGWLASLIGGVWLRIKKLIGIAGKRESITEEER